jgi:hypothetical protein
MNWRVASRYEMGEDGGGGWSFYIQEYETEMLV